MNQSEFYILVDTEKKETIDKFQKLPQNWKNISGLPGLSDQELEDLKWAGHYNLGWINLNSTKLKEFKFSQDNLQLNKNNLKNLVSKKRKEVQNTLIDFKGAKFKINNKTRLSLFLLKNSKKEKINFKCINEYRSFSVIEICEIFEFLENKSQELFDLEMQIYEKIDNCETIKDLSKLNLEFKINI
jgi:hypothetical protein